LTIIKKDFGVAEADNIGYCTKYISKKYDGEKENDVYLKTGRENVFRLMSQGIGQKYVDENAEELQDALSIRQKGKERALPRYYIKRLGLYGSKKLRTKSLENDCEEIEKLTGVYMTSEQLYKNCDKKMNENVIKRSQEKKQQHERNLNAKLNLKQSKL